MKATIHFHTPNEIFNYFQLNWAKNLEAKAICSSHVLRFYLFSQKLAHFSNAKFAIKKFFYYFSSNSTRCSICYFLCQISFLTLFNDPQFEVFRGCFDGAGEFIYDVNEFMSYIAVKQKQLSSFLSKAFSKLSNVMAWNDFTHEPFAHASTEAFCERQKMPEF